MHDKVDVFFHQGIPHIVITGGANLVGGIETTVKDGWLVIANKNKCNWVRDFNKRIRADVFTDSLIQVDNYGSGNFNCADTILSTAFRYDNWNATGKMELLLNTRRFNMNIHTGVADLTGYGQSEVLILYYSGYGYVDLYGLQGNLIYMNNSGSGNMYISVKDELYPTIEESGNIFYKGDPSVITAHITGSGRLIKAD